MENQQQKDYTVIVDETCPEHGGHNFAYQYYDENFIRLENFCEGCQDNQHQTIPSAEIQALRAGRSHERPQLYRHI